VRLTVVPVMATLFIDRIKLNPDEGAQHHDSSSSASTRRC